MFIKKLSECNEIIAGDNTVLREVLSPLREELLLGYSLAHARVLPGETTIPHRLKSSEVYYILEGEGEMSIDEEKEKVSSGYSIYIPPNGVQYIKNTGKGELVFLCIVEPAWKPTDEEIL